MIDRRKPIGGPAGVVLESLFRFGVGVRGRLYSSRLLPVARLPVPVVSVGNLTVGGTGKTPVVIHLADRLTAAGWRVALLSRGYGRENAGRLLSLPVGREIQDGDHLRFGDEPSLFRSFLPGLPVFLAPDRVKAGRAAIRDQGADILLLDDGMQHRKLHRDQEIVVVRGREPFGNGYMLPRGSLREPPGAIARATLVLIHTGSGEDGDLESLLDRAGAPRARARFRYDPDVVIPPEGENIPAGPFLKGRPVLAVSGIGNPDSFSATLSDAGAVQKGTLIFGDHHRFQPGDCERIALEAARLNAVPVTTEKDRIRLTAFQIVTAGIHALRIRVRFQSGEEYLDAMVNNLAGER